MSRTGRPSVTRDAVLAALSTCDASLGIQFQQVVAASGIKPRSVSEALSELVRERKVFREGRGKHVRYFITSEQRDELWPMVKAMLDEASERALKARIARAAERRKNDPILRAKRQEYDKQRHSANPRLEPKPQAVRPQVSPRREFAVPVHIKRRGRAPDGPVIIPPDVKVVVCPPCQPLSFRPPESFRGEFCAEWDRLRSHGAARKRPSQGATPGDGE